MSLTPSQLKACIAQLPTDTLALVESHPELALDRETLIEKLLKAVIVSERTHYKDKERMSHPEMVTTLTLEIQLEWTPGMVPSWEALRNWDILEPVESDGEWYDIYLYDPIVTRTENGISLKRMSDGEQLRGTYTQIPKKIMCSLP